MQWPPHAPCCVGPHGSGQESGTIALVTQARCPSDSTSHNRSDYADVESFLPTPVLPLARKDRLRLSPHFPCRRQPYGLKHKTYVLPTKLTP